MSAQVDERIIEQTEESLDSDRAHAFCPICVPEIVGKSGRDFVPALCGALVLDASIPNARFPGEEMIKPSNACPRCWAFNFCPVCGAPQ